MYSAYTLAASNVSYPRCGREIGGLTTYVKMSRNCIKAGAGSQQDDLCLMQKSSKAGDPKMMDVDPYH